MTFLDKLLNYYGINELEYNKLTKAATFDNLPSYENFEGIELIVSRIRKAISNNEKIVIYGDYDCDGVMATSILYGTFKLLNYNVEYFLPSRYLDGYGLTTKNVEKFHKKGINLIITVDNGVSQHEAVKLANSLGIDVIVTDHHEVSAEIAPAYATMHPLISGYGETVCCGAYVAFMLSRALLDKYVPYFALLAGIATIADMMVLTSYNREIVRIAFDIASTNNYYAIRLLGETNILDESIVGMKIAPKINAVGRICERYELNVLVEYLTTGNKNRIRDIYQWVETVNNERKVAMSEVISAHQTIDDSDFAIVELTDAKEGIIGLLAARYLNLYNRPAIVFTPQTGNPNVLKASARSHKGFNIAKAFKSLSHLFIAYGGHELAGGCSLEIKNFEEFKKQFNQLAKKHKFEDVENKVLEIEIGDVTYDNYLIYAGLGPFGQGAPKPLFLIKNYHSSLFTYSSDTKHIITNVTRSGKIIWFNYDKELFDVPKNVDIYGYFAKNEFKGKLTVNYFVENATESDVL